MTPLGWHTLFEMLAYAVGYRLFLRERRRLVPPGLRDRERSLMVGVGAIYGAALDAKLSFTET